MAKRKGGVRRGMEERGNVNEVEKDVEKEGLSTRSKVEGGQGNRREGGTTGWRLKIRGETREGGR